MLSVIIPTLNEEKNIPLIIRELKKVKVRKEIIFVDDNSSDNTKKIIKNFLNKKIKLINRKNQLKDLSKSVLMGVNNAKYNYIMVIDCDLQHNISIADKMLKKLILNKYDIVIGSRFKKKKYSGNLGILRSLFSLIFIVIINFILRKKTSDPLSGFFICNKSLVQKFKNNFFKKGYKIMFDIIYNGKQDIKIKDFQIEFKKRLYGKSKLGYRIVIIFIKQFFYTVIRKFNYPKFRG